MYVLAKQTQAEVLIEEALDLVDDDSHDILGTVDGKPIFNRLTIQRCKMKVDHVGEITRNSKDKTFAAPVSFHATSAGKGIEFDAIIIHEPANETQLRFISFTPSKVKKVGNW